MTIPAELYVPQAIPKSKTQRPQEPINNRGAHQHLNEAHKHIAMPHLTQHMSADAHQCVTYCPGTHLSLSPTYSSKEGALARALLLLVGWDIESSECVGGRVGRELVKAYVSITLAL